MKKNILFLVIVLTQIAYSQNKQVLYNFAGIPQTLLTNPGTDVTYEWYVGVPLLSGISVHAGSNAFSAYDLFAKNNGDFNDKLRKVVFNSDSKEKLMLNEQVEVFSGGFKLGDWQQESYVSFGLYQEFNLTAYIPKDPAILVLDGNQNYIGKSFNLEDINFQTEMLSVWHIGYHKKISKELVLGARVKLYSSGFTVKSTQNSGYIFTGTENNTTIYNQIISSNLLVQTSGVTTYLEEEYNGKIGSDIAKRTFFKGDLGAGFDLGLTYYPKKDWQLTASVLDVGFIKHSKNPVTYTYKGYYKYEGINPNFTPNNEPNDILDDFEKAIPRDTVYTKFTTWRPVKLNASAQYSFGKSKSESCDCKEQERDFQNGIGLQFYTMSMPKTPFVALTAFYQRSLFNQLQLKTTYTIDSFSYKNIGLGLSANLGKINLYTLVDNVLEYRDLSKANSLSFQFGINFIIPQKNNYYN